VQYFIGLVRSGGAMAEKKCTRIYNVRLTFVVRNYVRPLPLLNMALTR